MPAPVGPIATGLFWWLLSRTTNPAQLENLIARIPLTRSSLVTLAKVLFGLGLTRYLSSEFSLYALNNYRSADTKRWDWPNEIAVVTGGCSGIGEEIVRALAKKGVKVAVLDMAPLPDRLKDGGFELSRAYCKADSHYSRRPPRQVRRNRCRGGSQCRRGDSSQAW